MGSQPGIVLYRLEYESVRDKLSFEQKGILLDALMDFSETGEEYQGDDPFVSMAFAFFSAAIRRSAEQYERRRRANQENIARRWHKDDDDPDTNDTNGTNGTNGTNSIPTIPIETTKPNKTNPNSNETKRKRSGNSFSPPTTEEVAAYCRERGNGIDPEAFVSYYQRQGWVLNNGRPMRDWKSAVITWEKHGRGRSGDIHGDRDGDRIQGQRDLYVL